MGPLAPLVFLVSLFCALETDCAPTYNQNDARKIPNGKTPSVENSQWGNSQCGKFPVTF